MGTLLWPVVSLIATTVSVFTWRSCKKFESRCKSYLESLQKQYETQRQCKCEPDWEYGHKERPEAPLSWIEKAEKNYARAQQKTLYARNLAFATLGCFVLSSVASVLGI